MMHVSIWQQFSSNHSSYFAVVGRFKTVEAAQAVENELLGWMDRITAVWEINRKTNPSVERTLTVPETALVAKYKLAWYENGMHWNGIPEKSEVVVRVQNDVFFICPLETDDRCTPVIELLEKLGADDVVHAQGDLAELYAFLTCDAPDDAKARSFVDDMTTSFVSKRDPMMRVVWFKKGEYKSGPGHAYCEVLSKGRNIQVQIRSFKLGYFMDDFIDHLQHNGFTNIDYEISNESLAGRFEA